jgi:hypothetical protein
MRTTDNKELGPTSTSDNDVNRDAGLSSAMHEIRLLAEHYRDEREAASDQRPDVQVLGGAIDPRVLLMPATRPRTDSYRIAMLAMMILVGLSTSAIAVRMAFHAAPSQGVSAPATQPATQLATQPASKGLPEAARPLEGNEPEGTAKGEAQAYELKRTPARNQKPRDSRDQVVPPAPKAKRGRIKSQTQSSGAPRVKADTGPSCDEVACLVGDADACCGQEFEQQADSIRSAESLEGRPYRLSRGQVMEPMQSVAGRVRSCADKSEYQGIAMVKIVIAANGRVSSFQLDDGGADFQACVEGHVSGLRFPLLRQPFTVSYPYILR